MLNAVVEVHLDRILKTVIIFKGLMIEWVVVKVNIRFATVLFYILNKLVEYGLNCLKQGRFRLAYKGSWTK